MCSKSSSNQVTTRNNLATDNSMIIWTSSSQQQRVQNSSIALISIYIFSKQHRSFIKYQEHILHFHSIWKKETTQKQRQTIFDSQQQTFNNDSISPQNSARNVMLEISVFLLHDFRPYILSNIIHTYHSHKHVHYFDRNNLVAYVAYAMHVRLKFANEAFK